jgi:DNA-binding Lrp family transcriptional regulator
LFRDEIDRRIVASLVDDARASYAQIGADVGLTAPAVKRRVDRLLDDGVLLGFTAVVNPAAEGDQTDTFIELFCRGRTHPADILQAVVHQTQVVAAYTVTGDADALVHVRTHDIAELEDVLERIRDHPDVDRTKTIVVLSRLLHRDSP